jgi:hypothetical protein
VDGKLVAHSVDMPAGEQPTQVWFGPHMGAEADLQSDDVMHATGAPMSPMSGAGTVSLVEHAWLGTSQ